MPRNTEDGTDEFDKMLERISRSPDRPAGITDAAAYVHDTLKLALVSAKVIFGKSATPEIALAIYDRIAAEHKARDKSE